MMTALRDKFLRKKSIPGWLAVSLTPGRADFVHLQRLRDARPRVLLAESIKRGADDAALLADLRKPLHLDGYRCTALLAPGQYQLIQTDAVDGPLVEARETLRWKLKDQVDFPVESAAVDLLPIAANRTPQVFVAMAPASTVAPVVESFQAAKLALAAIDLPEMAQRNLAALFEEAGRGLATLIFDDYEGLLTFTAGGEFLAARHIDIAARQLMAADAARREALFERIALDVQRSLDNFDRMYSAVPLARLLVANIPGVAGFLDYLRANLTVSIEPLDLAAVLDLGATPALLDPARQFQCLRAIGAALRDEPETA